MDPRTPEGPDDTLMDEVSEEIVDERIEEDSSWFLEALGELSEEEGEGMWKAFVKGADAELVSILKEEVQKYLTPTDAEVLERIEG